MSFQFYYSKNYVGCKKQGGHIIVEETVTSFTKEKTGGQKYTKKMDCNGLRKVR